jgi:hypothetical protein
MRGSRWWVIQSSRCTKRSCHAGLSQSRNISIPIGVVFASSLLKRQGEREERKSCAQERWHKGKRIWQSMIIIAIFTPGTRMLAMVFVFMRGRRDLIGLPQINKSGAICLPFRSNFVLYCLHCLAPLPRGSSQRSSAQPILRRCGHYNVAPLVILQYITSLRTWLKI